MCSISRWWGIVLLLCGLAILAGGPAVAAQPKGKKKAPSPPPPSAAKDPDETKHKQPIESDDLPPGGYRGKLVSAPNEGGLFRIAVEYQRIRVKPGKRAEYERIQKDMANQMAKAAKNQTRTQVRVALTPTTRNGKAALPDRRGIAWMAGETAGAVAKFEAQDARLKGMFEAVKDTQTVIFHAAPQVQVRTLSPSSKQTSVLATPQEIADDNKTKQQKTVLPGYEGALSDLKVGQRLLFQVEPAKNEGKRKGAAPESIYSRVVTAVVVEEDAKAASP